MKNTSRSRANITRTFMAGLVGLCAVAASAAPAAASASGADDPLGPRMATACARVPNLTIRTENGLARLQADSATPGSLAWLQAQIDKAEAAGRSQVVTVLENRLAVRTSRIAVLNQQLVTLGEIAAACAESGAAA